MEQDFYNVQNATGCYDRSKNISHIQQYWDQSSSWEQFIDTPNLTVSVPLATLLQNVLELYQSSRCPGW